MYCHSAYFNSADCILSISYIILCILYVLVSDFIYCVHYYIGLVILYLHADECYPKNCYGGKINVYC